MGCDIHLQVDVFRDGKWQRVSSLPERPCSSCEGAGHYKNRPDATCHWCSGTGKDSEPYHDRNYTVFSVLADVRNDGYVKPICEPRGLPDDIHVTERGYEGHDPSDDDSEDGGFSFGDHSFSWLTLAEVLAYDWQQSFKDEGWVNREAFAEWDARGQKGAPKGWCGGVGGANVVHVSHSEMRRRIAHPYGWEKNDCPYTLAQWTFTVGDYCKWFRAFAETLIQLGPPEHTRLVFGFDS